MVKKELTDEQKIKEIKSHLNIDTSLSTLKISNYKANIHYIDNLSNSKSNDIAILAKSNFTKKNKKIKNNLKVKRR